MPSLSGKNRANLTAILDAIRKIEGFTCSIQDADQFFKNELVFDGVLMNFIFFEEVSAKWSAEIQQILVEGQYA